MAVLSPHPTPQQPPKLMAVSGNLDNVSAQGLGGGSRAGLELSLLRCELPRPQACGICLSAPAWHCAWHRADTPYCLLAKKK